jgi:hypothetical protein
MVISASREFLHDFVCSARKSGPHSVSLQRGCQSLRIDRHADQSAQKTLYVEKTISVERQKEYPDMEQANLV